MGRAGAALCSNAPGGLKQPDERRCATVVTHDLKNRFRIFIFQATDGDESGAALDFLACHPDRRRIRPSPPYNSRLEQDGGIWMALHPSLRNREEILYRDGDTMRGRVEGGSCAECLHFPLQGVFKKALS